MSYNNPNKTGKNVPGNKTEFESKFKSEWIKSGIVRETDSYAEKFGNFLKNNGLSTSQIRNIFGEIKNLQMRISNDSDFEKEKGRFILAKAKMAYAVARNNNDGLRNFRKIFDLAHNEVVNKESFDRFVAFITAILAYHKAAGGK